MNDELKRLHAENATKAAADSDIVKRQIRQRLERILKRLQASGEVKPHVTVDDWIKGDDDGAHS